MRDKRATRERNRLRIFTYAININTTRWRPRNSLRELLVQKLNEKMLFRYKIVISYRGRRYFLLRIPFQPEGFARGLKRYPREKIMVSKVRI